MDDTPRRFGRRPFWLSLRELIGHILGTAVLFLVVALVPWGLGFMVSAIDRLHPFNPTVKNIIEGVELAFMILDIGLSGFVLLVGAGRFCKEVWHRG